jgi:hypothetical protein
MTQFLSPYFCITYNFFNFTHFCSEDEGTVLLESIGTAYMTAQCHEPKGHNIYVGEIIVEPSSASSEILVNHTAYPWIGPKMSTCQALPYHNG